MSSEEALAIKQIYAGWAARLLSNPPMDLAATRDMFETWHMLGAEASGVSFDEIKAAGLPAIWCIPQNCARDRVILYFHGGGYVVGSMHSHRKIAAHLAKSVGCVSLVLDYRRAPEYPHPAPWEDAVSVFRWLLTQGYTADHIVLAGDSAGGGLATAAAVSIRDLDVPLPAAVLAASPFYDMELQGESLTSRAAVDVLVQQPILAGMVATFLGGRAPRDPLANVLCADLEGLPPIMIVAGDHEVLLDDSVRFAAKARAAGVSVELDIFPEMQHVFILGAGKVPEADAAIAKMARWVRPLLNL